MEKTFNDVKITSSFEMPETRENLVSGETIGKHFGKIAKHISDTDIHVSVDDKTKWNALSGNNLIDNSDFLVNQRGKSSYTSVGYTVDRWSINIGKIDVSQNGVTITNNATGTMRFRQNLEMAYEQIAGTTISFSASINGSVYSATAEIPAEKPTATFTRLAGVDVSDKVSFSFNYSSTDNLLFVYISILEGGEAVVCKWTKLEAGLPTNFIPSNKSLELIKCQRYYQIRSANNTADVDLRPTMYKTPTITALDNGNYSYSAET